MVGISVQEAKELIKENEDLIIIDVRTYQEYQQGHIEDAINIPLDKIQDEEFSNEDDYLLYCRSDARSRFANKILKSKGIDSKFIIGGYLDWVNN